MTGDNEQNSGSKRSQFQKGHAKLGGRRKKNFTLQVRELCQTMGINPIQIALDLIATGKLPGTAERATMAQRLKALDAILPFCTPKLSSNTTVAAVKVDQSTTSFDVTQLMKDPKLAEAAQTIALAMVDAELAQDNQTPNLRAIDGPYQPDEE